MSVQAAINGLNAIMQCVSGLRVYTDPPESINQFPACITYVQSGTMEDSARGGMSLHTLACEIYVARQLLPQAVDAAKTWPDTVFGKLRTADTTWNGAIAHVVWPMRYRAGPMQYGPTQDGLHYGVKFEIQVKVLEA